MAWQLDAKSVLVGVVLACVVGFLARGVGDRLALGQPVAAIEPRFQISSTGAYLTTPRPQAIMVDRNAGRVYMLLTEKRAKQHDERIAADDPDHRYVLRVMAERPK